MKQTRFKIVKRRSKTEPFGIQLIANNGKFLIPVEGYHNKNDALKAIRLIMDTDHDTLIEDETI